MHINKLSMLVAVATLSTRAMAQETTIFPKGEKPPTSTTWVRSTSAN